MNVTSTLLHSTLINDYTNENKVPHYKHNKSQLERLPRVIVLQENITKPANLYIFSPLRRNAASLSIRVTRECVEFINVKLNLSIYL